MTDVECNINNIMEKMTIEELGMLIISKACSMEEKAEIDVIDFINTCILVVQAIKESTSISPTYLFDTLQYIMNQLQEVASDGGNLEVYKVKKEEKK